MIVTPWLSTHRHRLIVAVGVALALPALAIPLSLDDLLHVGTLEGRNPTSVRWWELFGLVPGSEGREALLQGGFLPWWSAPDLKLSLLRPLSSALIATDHMLFGRNAMGWQAHSLLWWAALLFASNALYRKVLPATLALLALVVFAIDDSHWMPIGWPAARNGLVALVPSVLGLLAHVRWRQEGWRPGAVLGPVGLTVGLAGGEAAVAMTAYFAAFELIGRRDDTVVRRFNALAPYALVVGIYFSVRIWLGAGVHGSGAYIDPTNDPFIFAREATRRVPALAGSLLLGTSADWWSGGPLYELVLLATGIFALSVVAVWLWLLVRRRPSEEGCTILWLATGAFLGLFPSASAMMGDRLLLPSSLGAAPVIAALILDAGRQWRLLPRHSGRRLVAAVALTLFTVPNLVIAGPRLTNRLIRWKAVAETARDGVCSSSPELMSGTRQPARILVLWSGQPWLATASSAVQWYYCPTEVAFWGVVSVAPQAQRLTRVAPDELLLLTDSKPLLGTAWEHLYRDERYVSRVGDRVEQGGLIFTVQAVAAGRPTQLSIRFPTVIEDSGFRLALQPGARLIEVAPPRADTPLVFGNPNF